MSQQDTDASKSFLLSITSFEMERDIKEEEPDDRGFVRASIVPDSMKITLTLDGGQKIILSGSGVPLAYPAFFKVLEAADKLSKDKTLRGYQVSLPSNLGEIQPLSESPKP